MNELFQSAETCSKIELQLRARLIDEPQRREAAPWLVGDLQFNAQPLFEHQSAEYQNCILQFALQHHFDLLASAKLFIDARDELHREARRPHPSGDTCFC